MAKPEREVVYPVKGDDLDVNVVALWYGEPHNCWRVEIRGSGGLDYQLDNMTVEDAAVLARELTDAAILARALTPDVEQSAGVVGNQPT